MDMKTPGVYIVDKNMFPNSVVEVATAVPAFVGYTQTALNASKSLANKPWRITTMAEYECYFGGAPDARFTAQTIADAVTPPPAPDMTSARGQAITFTLASKHYLLAREPGQRGGRYLMYQAMRHFFLNGGGPCYVVSVGDYESDISAGDDTTGLIGGITVLLKEQEPTLLVVPDAVLLPKADCVTVQQAMIKHCGLDTRNRFALLDIWGGDLSRSSEMGDCVDDFRREIGVNFLDYAAAYYPWLQTSLMQESELDFAVITNLPELASLIADELDLANAVAGDKKAAVQLAVLEDLNRDNNSWLVKITSDIDASQKSPAEKVQAKAQLQEPATFAVTLARYRRDVHSALGAISTLYRRLLHEALTLVNLLPPSPAIAGLYSMVDNSRGVWKAPANISLAGVISPSVAISAADQEDLNLTSSGKSINAIRRFIGEGTLVWGARTLDGNSLDWRDVNVRRTMIMLEESCRLAAKAFVFEPNVASTWLTIKSMISNFLTGIWKRGGLSGASSDDAFSVHVGLGETMTPEDILEGILRISVLVAISRPAEFIEITFQQQMQKS